MTAKHKKAQVTVMIIVGLLAVMVISLLVYVSTVSVEKPSEEVLKKETEVSFEGKSEIISYVQSCIKPSVLEGLEIMRLQSGHILLPKDAINLIVSRNEYIKVINGTPYVENANGHNLVPFWLNRNSVSIPTLQDMENELADFVKKRVSECVGNFESFKNQGFDIRAGNLRVDVIMEKSVLVNVDFPLEIRKGDAVHTIRTFQYKVPVDMQLIHAIASDLVRIESGLFFLEDHTLKLISLFGGVDKDRLPPMTGVIANLDCSYVSWSKQDVKEKLKGILSENVPLLRIANTDFERSTSKDPIVRGVYNGFVYHFFSNEFPNIKVDFVYNPEWDIQFDVSPSEGNQIIPNRFSRRGLPMIPLFCSFDYNFKYDVRYPVIIRVTDKESARIDPESKSYTERGGFVFEVPVDVVVYGNQPREFVEGVSSNQRSIIKEAAEKSNVSLLSKSYFCDRKQRISNLYSIQVYDAFTREAVPDAEISYYGGNYQTECFIGKTGAKGMLKTRLPVCYNCLLIIKKKGYKTSREIITTTKGNTTNTKAVFLEPEVKVEVEVKKVHLPTFVKNYELSKGFTEPHCGKSSEDLLKESIMQLSQKDTAIIYLKGPSEKTIIQPPMANISLSSGIYDIDAILQSYIKVRPSVYDINGEKQVIAWTKDKSTYYGIYTIGSHEYEAEIPYLNNKRKITFYVFVEHDSTEDLEVKDFDNPILQNDSSLKARVELDEDCNPMTQQVEKEVVIKKENYMKFISPRIE